MKRKEQGFGLVEALLILITIGLLVALCWIFFNKQSSTTSSEKKSSSEQQVTSNLRPEDVMAKVESVLSSSHNVVDMEKYKSPSDGQIAIKKGTYSPAYKPDGSSFYVMHKQGSSLDLDVGPSINAINVARDIDITVRKEVAKVYSDLGLTKSTTYADGDNTLAKDIYTGKGLVCSVEGLNVTSEFSYANCGQINTYKDVAEKLKPMASAISGMSASTVLGEPQIKDSPISGYQKAEVSMSSVDGIGGSQALLYRKSSGSWAYFMSVQSVQMCTDYNTQDLKSAFNGDACIDSNNQQVTVK
jgi:competence protein ComGC